MSTSFSIVAICILLALVEFLEYGQAGLTLSSPSYQFGPQLLPVSHHSLVRSKREAEAVAPPSSYFSGGSSNQFIPKIAPPQPGTILTYDGKPISTSIGAFSIVPKTERRTPSINRNRPQYAAFRGQLPPPIPDVVPQDLPQFKQNRRIDSDSNFSPSFA